MQHTTYEMCISHSIHDPEVHPMGPLFCFDCCNLFLWTPFTLSASKANITELQCLFPLFAQTISLLWQEVEFLVLYCLCIMNSIFHIRSAAMQSKVNFRI